ncbi:hypothetical protein MHA_2580 [Mannheimia haemolytica PHL213]|nr:hypothetical protein MHA_2580 [Mannheimia haemolytica PHL213]
MINNKILTNFVCLVIFRPILIEKISVKQQFPN